MLNLLIAAGAAVVAYGLGAWLAGWIAGFIPAILAFFVVAWVLGSRTGKRVQAIVAQAAVPMQAGNLDETRRILESALPLGRWQILVEEPIRMQLGMVDYVDGVRLKLERQPTASKERLARARTHLEAAIPTGWKASLLRDWRAPLVLACLHYREERLDDALKVLTAAKGHAKSEPIYWGIWAWILNEKHRREEALQVLGEGLQGSPKSEGLREMQEALSNKKRPSHKVWGDAWYNYFPEDIAKDQEKVIELQRAMAQRRPPKTWPQPRR